MRAAYAARARDDIDDIFNHRSTHHSREVADRIERALREAVEMLAAHPQFGGRTDHRDEVRRWALTEYPYTIFYRSDWDTHTITIVRVVAGQRVRDLKGMPRS